MQDIDVKIEHWKKQLLDLGKRNRLINFKETKRSNIAIITPSYDELYKRLVQNEEKFRFPMPVKNTYEENSEEFDMLGEKGDIETNKTLIEQQKTLKVLRERAKAYMEEQGINSLYLTFGMIRWKESDTSQVIISSPLVLVPVTLTIESITDPYVLQLHEDEIVINPSLTFKFENDFGIILPEFDNHEDNIPEYLSQIKKIAQKNDWEVGTDVNLTLLSFLKINMYKDLDNNKDRIVSNPIIKALSGDKSEIHSIPSELNNFNHDKNIRPIDTYQVVDADSSQQDAILLSKKGISFVLQGPPGTGKSQTITNIIAEAISDGKKVLFVSEKMAALEVVKKRLTEVGLEDFCLTLHSYKANKKEILNQLAKTLNKQRISLREDAIYKLSALEEKRNKLNEYQKQLHEKCAPLNISIYEANGRLAKLSDTQDIIFDISNVENTDVELFNKYKYLLTEFSKTIGNLSEDYTNNPWYASNVPVVTHELRHDIEVNLTKLSFMIIDLIKIYEDIIEKTGANIELTIHNMSTLSEFLKLSSESPLFPKGWLNMDTTALICKAHKFLDISKEYDEKKNNLLKRYEEDILELNATDIISTIEINMNDVRVYLDNTNFPSNKDIVLKADFLLNECQEIKSFILKLFYKSKEISETLGIEKQNTICSILEYDKLINLILKKSNPEEVWFTEGKIKSIEELLETAENEQFYLHDKLQKIKLKYNEDILKVDFNELLLRFKTSYFYVLNIISKSMNLSSLLDLNRKKIVSFADSNGEKLNKLYLYISDAFDVSKQIAEELGVKPVQTLKELISLTKHLESVIQNPKPTLAWFDNNKECIIDKVISDVRECHKEIKRETDDILAKYNKDILEIDYKNLLVKFNVNYRSLFKYLNRNYRADKKLLLGFNKVPNSKLTDNEIIDLLNKLTFIKEKEQWLMENKALANEMLGDLYIGKYTNWDLIDKSRENFRIIKTYFGMNKISNQLKNILLTDDTEKLVGEYSILSKVIDNDILNYVEGILGKDVGEQTIPEVLNIMQDVTNTSTKIKNDYDNILNYVVNTNEIDNITVNDIIDVLSLIKEVDQRKKWFCDKHRNLLESFGKYYHGENTDWSSIKSSINVVKQIYEYFGKNQISQKLINYLVYCPNQHDNLQKYKTYIEEINKLGIVKRLNNLLNIDNINIVDFNKIVSTLETIENGVNLSYSRYMEFSCCSKNIMQFETIMTDIILLNRIQEIEKNVEKDYSQLQFEYDFMFDGINTNWNKIILSLEYANKFNELRGNYCLSAEYIDEISGNKDISKWALEKSEKLKEEELYIKSIFDWFANLFDNGNVFYDISIYKILDRVEKCLNNLALLEEWIDFRSIRLQCREVGLSEFVENVEKIQMPPQIILNTFFKRFYRLWLDAMMPKHTAVYTFRSRTHESLIAEFKELDKVQLKIARLRILEKLISKLPDTNIATSSVDEVGVLKREITKQRKIMPLRKLFKAIPNLLTALKPCLMMSPLSVSIFLQADGYNFDLVIFDEASQVCTEDAIGAIMRGKQVIIAGDSNQLPPTSFFEAALSDSDFDIDDEKEIDDTGAYESILEEAVNAIPEKTLKWHYRSRHEHLIAFSNAKIYNNELITFPSNMDKVPDNGVEYIFVENGIYDRGGKKNNINEAKRVAELVFDHIRKYPNRSLGVVTFSEAQQVAIDDVIRQIRLQNGQYEKFFSDDNEQAFFIKNLENVQGDERDTIIFSIGYAKDQNGVMYMNFGPLSRNGGHRRLNVAITRAKYNVKLVGSIHPTDIKLEKTNSEGVKMLRQYIEFAINGESTLQNQLNFSNTVETESPFEESVYDFLVKNGYNVATQVGCSGYRIDMAVKHPTLSGIFVLGIECDGATYHSARTARERDRLRQTVLEDIGWTIYRIWSTDWVKDPKTEGEKLIEAVKLAISGYKMSNLSTKYENLTEKNTLMEQAYVTVEKSKSENEDYNPYNFSYYKETDICKIDKSHNFQYPVDVIECVIKNEAPIHFELLCKRVASVFGNQKATIKVRNSVEWILNRNLKDKVVKKGDFYWYKDINKLEVRIPPLDGNARTISYISVEELAEAMFVIVGKSFGITKNDLYTITARIFGFNRVGGNITQSLEKACLYLMESGRVKEVDKKIVV